MSNEYSATSASEPISWQTLKVKDSTIEAIKWLAILLMTIDHINSYLILPITGKPYELLFNMGRVAFPLFALVIGYNLARPRTNKNERKAILDALLRLTVFGAISMLPYYFATGGRVLPLNIMYTLALGTALIYSLRVAADKESRLARYVIYFFTHLAFAALAWLGEFSFYGVALIVTAWLLFRYSSAFALLLTLTLIFLLQAVNGTYWAIAAIPIFIFGYFVEVKIPRINKYAFYAYYPLHLGLIAAAVALHNLYN